MTNKEAKEIMGLSDDEYLKIIRRNKNVEIKKLRERQSCLTQRKNEQYFLLNQAPSGQEWFSLDSIKEIESEQESISKKIKWLVSTKKSGNDDSKINIEATKAVPIVEILKRYGYEIKKNSHSIAYICCPFHNEKTPSGAIYKNNNHFYCFGCHRHADPLDIVMHIEGVKLPEAYKILVDNFRI